MSVVTIAVAQAGAGDPEGALETAGKIEDAVFKAQALRDIAPAQAKAGDTKGARATFVAALAVAAKIEDASGKARALAHFAVVLAGWK